MKYVKVLCLAAVSAAAMMAWVGAGAASATTLDCNGAACALNTVIHAENETTVTLHPPIGDIECKKSTVEGKVENLGSSTTTASGRIYALTFGECNAVVTPLPIKDTIEGKEVKTFGGLEIHTRTEKADNNGTLTSSGSEVTVEFAGFHCIFKTSSTDIGTVTGSAVTGGNATLDISAKIPRTGGRSGAFCGTEAEWTGSYKADKPASLNVT